MSMPALKESSSLLHWKPSDGTDTPITATERLQSSLGLTVVKWAVLREAERIRRDHEYRPYGFQNTLRWANDIIDSLPQTHQAPEELLEWLPTA